MLMSFFFRRYVAETYPSKVTFAGQYLGILIELSIYWFTAKAFGRAVTDDVNKYGMNYFDFILVGEISMAIPMALFSGVVRSLQNSVLEGTLDSYILSPRSTSMPFLSSTLAYGLREGLYVVTLLLSATLIFGFRISLPSILLISFTIAFSGLLFSALGLIAASFVVFFGRGIGVVSHLSNVAVVFAGTYFPLSVLPEWLWDGLKLASPFAFVLEGIRNSIAGNAIGNEIFYIFVWTLVTLPLGLLMFELSIRHYVKRGNPLLLIL